MKLKALAFLAIGLMILLSCSSDDSNMHTDPPGEPTLEQRLQTIVDSKVGADKLVGATVSIRIDGVERWNLSGGNSDISTPMNSLMRFGIASITKTVASACILKLEEEGLLTLDDTIADHLTITNPNIDTEITIFQLLNHLSGLDGYMVNELWDMVEADFTTAISSQDLTEFVLPPYSDPGIGYYYSNSNYLLLGMIIEAVSGQTVGDVMRSRFWTPLNLNNTYFGKDETIQGTIAAPWRDGNGDGSLTDISSEYGPAYHSVFFTSADVFTTAGDLSNWGHHLYAGNALSETSKSKMLDFITVDSGSPYWDGYGLGVRRIYLSSGREYWGHTGGMRGYGSYMLYDPNSGLTIAMLNNQSRSTNGPTLRFELVDELINEIMPEL
jgi:D-alanyl-D-alanine carboxypeptidase